MAFLFAILFWGILALVFWLTHKKVEQVKKGVIVLKDTQAELAELRGLEVELCGRWLWISGNFRQHERTLEKLGCRYHDSKGMWYWRDKRDKKTSKTDGWVISKIRERFGSVSLQDVLKGKGQGGSNFQRKARPQKEKPVEVSHSTSQGEEW